MMSSIFSKPLRTNWRKTTQIHWPVARPGWITAMLKGHELWNFSNFAHIWEKFETFQCSCPLRFFVKSCMDGLLVLKQLHYLLRWRCVLLYPSYTDSNKIEKTKTKYVRRCDALLYTINYWNCKTVWNWWSILFTHCRILVLRSKHPLMIFYVFFSKTNFIFEWCGRGWCGKNQIRLFWSFIYPTRINMLKPNKQQKIWKIFLLMYILHMK